MAFSFLSHLSNKTCIWNLSVSFVAHLSVLHFFFFFFCRSIEKTGWWRSVFYSFAFEWQNIKMIVKRLSNRFYVCLHFGNSKMRMFRFFFLVFFFLNHVWICWRWKCFSILFIIKHLLNPIRCDLCTCPLWTLILLK